MTEHKRSPPAITEVRIHGRGGQGNVAAAYLLAATAIREGRFAQAFPTFGAERRGAPVAAFVRIADRHLRRRCQVQHPGFLIIQDPTLLGVPSTLEGLLAGGAVLVNSNETSADLVRRLGLTSVASEAVETLPAGSMAQEVLGRPVPNTALLSAFITLTGLLGRDSLEAEVEGRFSAKGREVVDQNLELVRRASQAVPAGRWKEAIYAATA